MHDPERRILTANVKKVNRRGKNIKVEDTEAQNLVSKPAE